ncbi:MAG TPA: hypothetical protein VGV89_05405 [Thermoplasmata archaeon]|nr:hypothetical protein [Thermoplasmata archaeon]
MSNRAARRARRQAQVGAVGGLAAFAALLLLIAPGTLAGGSTPILLTAPFKVRMVTSSDYLVSSGNGSMNDTPPFFHRLTGAGGYWGHAVIPRCSGTCNSIQADYNPMFQPSLGVELPLSIPANRTSVALNSTLEFVETLQAHPSVCHFQNVSGLESICSWYDLWQVEVESPTLHDLTANRSYGPSNETVSASVPPTKVGTTYEWEGVKGYTDGCQVVGGANTCFSYSSGPISNRAAVHASWNTKFTVPATWTVHRYLLALTLSWVVWASVYTSVSGPKSARATLSGFSNTVELNMARAGDGVFLNSITLS